MKREAFVYKSSADNKRHICIDKLNNHEIFSFLKDDPARIKKFRHIVDLILRGYLNSELYAKEEISDKAKNVTAMKMFKRGQNIRIYCKEQTSENGIYYVIVSELVPKKKSQQVDKKLKSLIEKVAGYEYTIKPTSKE